MPLSNVNDIELSVPAIGEATAIVRALASCSSPNRHESSEYPMMCLLCEAIDAYSPDDHEPDCPWVLALAWAEAWPLPEARS